MQVTTRLTTGLALLLCASVAGAGDRSAYETSEQGWSTAHSCIEDQERDAKQCWTQTRGLSASGRFEASLMYVCWDYGAEKLAVWFQWTKGQASTESEPVLSVKWDDGTEQLLETISESRRKKKLSSKWLYRYVVKPERAPAFLNALHEHETLHVLLPYTKTEPIWTSYRLHNAIPSIEATMRACGIDQSSLGPLPN